MSWHDGDGADDPFGRTGRPGGDWHGMRPTLDNPMTWSLQLGRAWGIAVRLHIVFLLYIVIELVRGAMSPDAGTVAPRGVELVAIDLGALFLVVLLHEFGHCFACRRVGGTADEILMWPLGGLASCRPPHEWRAHFLTAAGGPLVNVAILAVLAPVLGLLTGTWWGVAIPNPLHPPPFGALQVGGAHPWWLEVVFSVHLMSFVLLLFNLLPIFPLDGGRLCQSILWPRLGYGRSMRMAVHVGYFGALALVIFGAVTGQWILIGIAAFGGITCYMTVKQLEFTDSIMGGDADLYAAARWSEVEIDGADEEQEVPVAPRPAVRPAAAAAEEAGDEGADIDRILAKISREGVESLSVGERGVLQRATDRRRREDEERSRKS